MDPGAKAKLDADFSDLYRAHLKDVYSYSYYRIGNHHDAEDLTEQTFLQAYRHFERAQRYFPKGPGSVFSFGVKGSATRDSRSVGQTFIESVDLASHLANIGDAKTLVIHPASTTHAQLTEQQLLDAGVLPGLVRISVGIEDPEDILYDLDQALNAAVKG